MIERVMRRAHVSSALRVATTETSHASIHLHDRFGGALDAKLRVGGEVAVLIGRFAGIAALHFRFFRFDELPASLIHLFRRDQTDGFEMRFDQVAQFGDQRRRIFTLFEVATARIEHAVQFFNEESAIAALAEHRGDDARERHDPLEVILHTLN